MKNKLALFAAVLMVFSCTQPVPDIESRPVEGHITIPITHSDFIQIGSKGGWGVIEFSTNRKWTAKNINTDFEDWCILSHTAGEEGEHKIYIQANENPECTERWANIEITCGSDKKHIEIYQYPKNELKLPSTYYSARTSGEVLDIEVQSNMHFAYEVNPDCSEWIQPTSTKNPESFYFQFYIAPNDTPYDRYGQIKFKSDGHEDELGDVVTIYQQGNAHIGTESDNYNLFSEGGNFTVGLVSNIQYNVNILADWITEVTSKAYTTSERTFYVSPLPEGSSSRTGTIEFSHPKFGLTKTITVTQQEFLEIVLDKTSIELFQQEQATIAQASTIQMDPLYWESSNPEVASVTQQGKSGRITAISPGEAIITARTADGRYRGTCKVTVQDINDYVYLLYLPLGQSQYIDGYVQPSSKLSWYFYNHTSETIYVSYLQIVDPKDSYEGNMMNVGTYVYAGKNEAWTITLGSATYLRSPCLKIYYEYKNIDYTYICESEYK